MGNIVEFTSKENLQPEDRAAATAREAGILKEREARETGVAIGRGVSSFGPGLQSMADSAERHTTFSQISHGAAIYSSLYADLTQQWNTVASKSDPNDTSVMQGFKEKVLQPALDNFQKGFEATTDEAQKWALSRSSELSQHFTQKMIGDMSTRAGTAAHKNIGDLERNYSNVVMFDPSALPHIEKSVKTDIAAMVDAMPYLTPAEAARIRDELEPKVVKSIGKATFYGMVDNNPAAAKAALAKGAFKDYFDAEETVRAEHFAKTVENQRRTEQEHEDALKEKALKKAQEDKTDAYFRNILAGKGAKGFDTDLGISRTDRKFLSDAMHQHTMQMREKKDSTPHPDLYRSIIDQMFITARDDPNNVAKIQVRIRDEFIKGNLNPREEAELEQRYGAIDKPLERNFHNQVLRVQHSIETSPTYAPVFASSPGRLAQVVTDIETEGYRKLRAAEARNEDVTPLIDPKSPKYLFRPEIVQTYLRPATKELSEQAAKVRAAGTATPAVGGKEPDLSGSRPASRVTRGRDEAKPGEQYLAPDGSVRIRGG